MIYSFIDEDTHNNIEFEIMGDNYIQKVDSEVKMNKKKVKVKGNEIEIYKSETFVEKDLIHIEGI